MPRKDIRLVDWPPAITRAGNAARLPVDAADECATVDAEVAPRGPMNLLSRAEVTRLLDQGRGGLHALFRNCALAVLSCGNELDSGKELLERYASFAIEIIQRPRGIKLALQGAPASAFVDGRMVRSIQDHLFAVLRDVIYAHDAIRDNPRFDLASSAGVTDAVFHILRNASILQPVSHPNVVVCWGGHSINREEYDYSKLVGYQLGLRELDICTGSGPGAMKGPMKGAAVAHAKQRTSGRHLGFTEPGIIAAEAPNAIVTDLVIFPDVEKRLEAFVRTGHGIVVFPGGVGTAEEILYILGVLSHPDNATMPFPLVFTGPKSAEGYFRQIDRFIGATLGKAAQARYRIVIDDPVAVAQEMQAGIRAVRAFRKDQRDAYHFNWLLQIEHEFQQPFHPSHAAMRALALHRLQPTHALAANLRRAFSGIVAGNVKAETIGAIEAAGSFELGGDQTVMGPMDELLSAFVSQGRMKLGRRSYSPCYRLVGKTPA